MKIGSKLRSASWDLQNEKREHPHLPNTFPSEVEGVRIVVISFRNVAKKDERMEGGIVFAVFADVNIKIVGK